MKINSSLGTTVILEHTKSVILEHRVKSVILEHKNGHFGTQNQWNRSFPNTKTVILEHRTISTLHISNHFLDRHTKSRAFQSDPPPITITQHHYLVHEVRGTSWNFGACKGGSQPVQKLTFSSVCVQMLISNAWERVFLIFGSKSAPWPRFLLPNENFIGVIRTLGLRWWQMITLLWKWLTPLRVHISNLMRMMMTDDNPAVEMTYAS